jgi:hypothetical protein
LSRAQLGVSFVGGITAITRRDDGGQRFAVVDPQTSELVVFSLR